MLQGNSVFGQSEISVNNSHDTLIFLFPHETKKSKTPKYIFFLDPRSFCVSWFNPSWQTSMTKSMTHSTPFCPTFWWSTPTWKPAFSCEMFIVILFGKNVNNYFSFTIILKSIWIEMEINHFDWPKPNLHQFGNLFSDSLCNALWVVFSYMFTLLCHILLSIIFVLGLLMTSKCHVHALK